MFDFNSTNLLQMAQKMRHEKKLPPGTEIKGEVDFAIGATDVPVDPPADWKPKSLMAKLDAGADFIQTQFCMDIEVVKRYGRRLIDLGIAPKLGFLIGLCPIPSATLGDLDEGKTVRHQHPRRDRQAHRGRAAISAPRAARSASS